MQLSLSFIRILFLGLCILFLTTYAIASSSEGIDYIRMAWGALAGLIFGCAVISLDALFKKFNLRSFNIATIGLFFGYLMGEAILLIFETVVDATKSHFPAETMTLLRMGVFLFSSYLGMVMTVRASDELYLSIPFIKFKPHNQKKKDLLIDSSLLLDPRLIDLAASGLLDHRLILPRYFIKDLNEMSESQDEMIRTKARRSLDVIKKLESIPLLDFRYAEIDFPETKDPMAKLVRLARQIDANIFTADSNRIQQSTIEGIRIVNIHILSSALKPLAQTGEFLNIKIQRYGKEPRQGVGYLDDGTMVVVNGGAEFIGETIRAQVLSVKHTSSGRMIFCNALEEGLGMESNLAGLSGMAGMQGISGMSESYDSSAKSYFAL